MSKQTNSETGPNYEIADQILAKLYLDLVSSVGADEVRTATKPTLDMIADEYFNIERPSVLEIQNAVQGQIKGGQGLGGELYEYVLSELIVYYRDEFRSQVKETLEGIVQEQGTALPDAERQRTLEYILDFGPLQPYLADDNVSEILVDGAFRIYVERRGKLEAVPDRFRDDAHLMTVIHHILMPLGIRLDEMNPMVNARLPDWSMVNVVIPPISIVGPTLTIRKVSKTPLTWENLIEWGSVTPEALQFLRACVCARLNIVVSGGTASGKTTILNRMTDLIPGNERVITVEPGAELQPSPHLKHIVRLESQPPDREGKGEITMQSLVANALRMRPDRIVSSEVLGAEVLDLIRAMSTGHDGSLFSLYANSPRDALARLETMAMMGNPSVPVRTLRHEMASAIDLIVHQERLRDGSRKIVNVTEVQDTVGEVIVMQDIFAFEQTGFEGNKVMGRLKSTGIIPRFLVHLQDAGIELPLSMFSL